VHFHWIYSSFATSRIGGSRKARPGTVNLVMEGCNRRIVIGGDWLLDNVRWNCCLLSILEFSSWTCVFYHTIHIAWTCKSIYISNFMQVLVWSHPGDNTAIIVIWLMPYELALAGQWAQENSIPGFPPSLACLPFLPKKARMPAAHGGSDLIIPNHPKM
jgi:hypothetical protein